MRLCYINLTDSVPPRDAVYLRGLQAHGIELVEVRDSAPGLRKFYNIFKKHWGIRRSYDLAWVGYAGHILVPFVRLITTKKIVFNALGSLYEGIIVARAKAPAISWQAFYCWLIDFMAFHSATLTLVESDAQKNYLSKKFWISHGKLMRAWTGVDDRIFYHNPNVKKLPIFTVVFRGGFMPESGVEIAIAAAKILERNGINFRIIGSGQLEQRVQKIINSRSLKNVELIGRRLSAKELRVKMQECHLSLGQLSSHPRLNRTIPHKAFESIALCLPYLTARNNAILELLKEKETCLCCNPADAHDLANKILALKNSPHLARTLSDQAYTLYRQELFPNQLVLPVLSALSNMSAKQPKLKLKDRLKFKFIPNTIFGIYRFRPQKVKTLAIIKLDGIGDYILFRNFLETIRTSRRYHDYRITLCGNLLWQELAELYDGKFADEFYWIDKNKFRRQFFYKIKTIFQLLGRGFELAIHPTYSRDGLSDIIAKAAGIKQLIGDCGNTKNIRPEQKNITDTYYSQLINTGDEVIFEFNRNKLFVETVLGESTALMRPFLPSPLVATPVSLAPKIAILFPGASHPSHRWNTTYFAVVADYLYQKYHYQIQIGGSHSEQILAEQIMQRVNHSNIADKTGNSLLALASLIGKCDLLITNDTGALHLGVALGKPVIGLSDGRLFGRYTPYPTAVYSNIITVFPPEISETYSVELERLQAQYRHGSSLNINRIKPEQVMRKIDQLLA